jgi:putative endonuclease
MAKNINLGMAGEDAAADYLRSKAYTIRHRNWRFKHKEVDIIAYKDETIIFAEVKSRSGTYFEQPFQAVTKKKQRFLIEAANAYIEKYEIDWEARFDILSLVKKEKGFDIEHIKDAFYPLV